MRKIQIFLYTIAAVLLAVVGCSRENLQELSSGEGDLVVRVSLSGISTRVPSGTREGTDDENRVTSLDILVYDDVTDVPVVKTRVAYSGSDQLDGTFTPTLEDGSGNPITTVDDLFGEDVEKMESAVVFAVANYAGDLSSLNCPLSDVKSLVMDAGDSFLSDTEPFQVLASPTFVMTAEGGFKKDSATGKAVAELHLMRLAAKISLTVTTPGEIQTSGYDSDFDAETTTTWTAMTEGKNTRIYLEHARRDALLGVVSADPVAYPAAAGGDSPFFSYGEVTMGEVSGSDAITATFYTYPMDLSDKSATYIKLILPWRYVTTIQQDGKTVTVDQNIVELYYKIMLPPALDRLDANTWYALPVEITVLGGEAARPVVQVLAGISIKEWVAPGGEDVAPVVYADANILRLEEDANISRVGASDPLYGSFDYVVSVNKGETFTFPYYASEDVEMTVDEIWFNHLDKGTVSSLTLDDGNIPKQIVVDDGRGADFNALTGYNGATPIDGIDRSDWYTVSGELPWKDEDAGEKGWVTYDNASNTISLRHILTTEVTDDDFSISTYYYDLTLTLENHPDKSIRVRIEQVPKIHVTPQLSQRKVFVNSISNNFTASNNNNKNLKSVSVDYPVYNLYGESIDYSFDTEYPSITSSNKDSYLGILRRRGMALAGNSNQDSRYRYLVEVVPYDNEVIVNDPLRTIDKTSDLGMVLTQSSTGTLSFGLFTSYSCLPIVLYGEFNYLYYNSNNCIVSSSVSGNSAGTFGNSDTHRELTKNVGRINYRAPELARTESLASSFIAPGFIVASSYGMSADILSFGQAFLRCATYQEDGYPAGRWRLPTEKEIEYLMILKNKGVIPNLVSGSYWASSGRRFTSSNDQYSFTTGSSEHAAARCVYDAWYWGNDPVQAADDTYRVMPVK